MHKLEELREMLMDELNQCTNKGEMSMSDLEVIDKLTHSIKSIDTILAMEEAEYSYEGGGSNNSYARDSYARARGRGRNARRDSMGRYARRGGSNRGSYEGSYGDSYGDSYEDGSYGSYRNSRRSNRGYSRDEAKDELMNELRGLQMDAKDEESKQMIKEWIQQLEQG